MKHFPRALRRFRLRRMRLWALAVLLAFSTGCLRSVPTKTVDYSVAVARIDACSDRCNEEFLEEATRANCYATCEGARKYPGKECRELTGTAPCSTVWSKGEDVEVTGTFYAIVFGVLGVVMTVFVVREIGKGA